MTGPRLYDSTELMEIVSAMQVAEAEKDLSLAHTALEKAQQVRYAAWRKHRQLHAAWQDAESRKPDKSLAWRIQVALFQITAVGARNAAEVPIMEEIDRAREYNYRHHLTEYEQLEAYRIEQLIMEAENAAIPGPGSPLFRVAVKVEEAFKLSRHLSIDEDNIFLPLNLARSQLWTLLGADERKALLELFQGEEWSWNAIQKLPGAPKEES